MAKADSSKVATQDSTAVAKVDTAKKQDTTHMAAAAGKDSGAAAAKDTNIAKADTAGKKDTSNPYAGLSQEETAKRYQKDHPFSSLLYTTMRTSEDAQPQQIAYISDNFPAGEYSFEVAGNMRDQIKHLINRSDVKSIWPEDIVLAFSANPVYTDPKNPDNSVYEMYLVNRDADLTGEVITDASPSFDPQTGKPMVLMQMNADGADAWANITSRNIKKRIAIVLDSAVYSAPTVQNKIAGGSSQITGSRDAKEANLLAVVLKAGALKAPVKIIEERIVGPSLGDDSIKQGINATLIGAGVVILFMLLYYAFGGFVADVAVMFNVLITLAILAAFGATLTLPGIGGLVLTIGMAVDGNVLIYERIREELGNGRSIKSAVELGYSKAWHAIIDTHITTFLTGAILYWFGTGPIQGFAVTLMIGIAATLFTAVFVTRTVFMYMLDRGTTSISFGERKELQAVTA
jgi:preprotein translocase subunit SecD